MENLGRPFDHLRVFVYDWSFVQLPWSNNIAKFMFSVYFNKGIFINIKYWWNIEWYTFKSCIYKQVLQCLLCQRAILQIYNSIADV